MLYCGIDEAGLGPILGPLVTSAVAFRVTDAAPGEDVNLWDRLRDAVAEKPGRKESRIAIGDSKKLFKRKVKNGLAPLERGVLGSLLAKIATDPSPSDLPATLADLLNTVAPGSMEFARTYPWYGECNLPLPHAADTMGMELAANALRVSMRQRGVELLLMRAEPIFTREFNRRVAITDNKAAVTTELTTRRILDLYTALPYPHLNITVDRQGGRTHYREILQRVFMDASMKVHGEADEQSSYTLTNPDGRIVDITFRTKAENHSLPVALASMLSKYLRELCMELFNRFWAERHEGLAPTAGYYTDGKRFLKDIEPDIAALNLPKELYHRSR
ncbi:MAG: hypothetical protein HN909_06285 [Phycisphaerales bacterium]|jgi:ribonuclease HII|nr:hypothetical protein [Phycisphaerales bacterium]MBT7171360.1 hypothetical protein [Phycisphaerales bacterium]